MKLEQANTIAVKLTTKLIESSTLQFPSNAVRPDTQAKQLSIFVQTLAQELHKIDGDIDTSLL